jgi:hypothetical protein
MLRYWPLLAIVAVLAAIIGMSQDADSAKYRYEESARQAKATPIAKGNDGKASNNAEDAYKPPVWGKYVTFPEGVGAWAVILTLLAIAWQSIETREAAQSSLMQANHIVASERAWMIPKITQSTWQDVAAPQSKCENWYLPIQVTFTNRGKTPAIAINGLLEYSSESASNPTGTSWEPVLPETVKYIKVATKYAPGLVIVSEGTTVLIVAIPKSFLLQENTAWINCGKCLCIKGFLEYKDVFKETRISRFCFAYQLSQVGGSFTDEITGEQVFPPQFLKAGPGAYNEIG